MDVYTMHFIIKGTSQFYFYKLPAFLRNVAYTYCISNFHNGAASVCTGLIWKSTHFWL